jgi:hypothetical protein
MMLQMLSTAPDGVVFVGVLDTILEAFMLRETNVKDLCVELAKSGRIENTWGSGLRKPNDNTVIKLASA